MRKYGQEGFFRLTYVEPKHQSNSHNQAGVNDFQHLIWMFWVCQLFPTWYNIDYSQLMSRFDRYQLQLVHPNMEHGPVIKIQHETSQTNFDTALCHSTFSIHCTNLFLHFSCVFTFLEIIKHNMPKMLLFFLPSSIFKWLHKNSPMLIFFLNARWYDNCHIQSNKIVSNEVKDD